MQCRLCNPGRRSTKRNPFPVRRQISPSAPVESQVIRRFASLEWDRENLRCAVARGKEEDLFRRETIGGAGRDLCVSCRASPPSGGTIQMSLAMRLALRSGVVTVYAIHNPSGEICGSSTRCIEIKSLKVIARRIASAPVPWPPKIIPRSGSRPHSAQNSYSLHTVSRRAAAINTQRARSCHFKSAFAKLFEARMSQAVGAFVAPNPRPREISSMPSSSGCRYPGVAVRVGDDHVAPAMGFFLFVYRTVAPNLPARSSTSSGSVWNRRSSAPSPAAVHSSTRRTRDGGRRPGRHAA